MMGESTLPMLPGLGAQSSVEFEARWFAPFGCIVYRGDEREVYVGGLLIGRFEKSDQATRKVLTVMLAEDGRIKREALAQAFDISDSTLRYLVRTRKRGGLKAVAERKHGGGESTVTPAARRKLEALFAAGASVTAAHATVSKRYGRGTVGLVRKEWGERRRAELEAASASPDISPITDESTSTLTGRASNDSGSTAAPAITDGADATPATEHAHAAPAMEHSDAAPATTADVENASSVSAISGDVSSSAHLQHAGTWLCLGLLERHGLYRAFEATRREVGLEPQRLRVSVEALAAALCLGEGCAEGVRRLATPTAPQLLRVPRAPTEEFVRDTFRKLAEGGSTRAHLGLAGRYLVEAQRRGADDEATLFYVDNHLRPYTGKHVIRKGWRMQDKRVVPGTSDYWVHDADGRPVFRLDVAEHGSLCEWLRPIAEVICMALGGDARILLGFDRAGAFPEVLAELRDLNIEFVTYERRPYPALPASALTDTVDLDGETLRYGVSRINLGKGRGRLRRIAIIGDSGEQVNLLCGERTDAVQAIAAMRGRWCQENGFKHGVERWGLNQLDARKVDEYDPDAVIPNPMRRRLERAFRVACIAEGDLRRKLADLAADHPRRAKLEAALASTVDERRRLDAERASAPHHAPVKETILAGKLRRHRGVYKALLDTVRVAGANIEAELATLLAPHLTKPAEAKKTLAVLFAAPGRVRVGTRTIAITLAPAGSADEHEAYAQFWKDVNRLNLTLPGDQRGRGLRFHSAT